MAKKIITCWGDSITQGAWMALEDKYPTRLQALLGDGYEVLNGGYAGDSSYGIMARQGATGLKTKNAIIFAAGEKSVVIGHRVNGMGLLMDDGRELTKLNINQAQHDTPTFINCRHITVDGAPYTLRPMNFTDVDGVYDIALEREEAAAALTIPVGAKVVMNGTDIAPQNYCNIYLMGANDGVVDQSPAADIDALIDRYKKLIAHQGSDRYLVIVPYWGKRFDAPFIEAFGERAIPYRVLAATAGIATLGVTPTEQDAAMMADGLVPASMRYNGIPGEVHMSADGYRFLAKTVYDAGKKNGYWG